MACRVTNRYRHSKEFFRTNFSLGHENESDSTYRTDFNIAALPGSSTPDRKTRDHCHQTPKCTHCKYTSLIDAYDKYNPFVHDARRKPSSTGKSMPRKAQSQSTTTHVTFGNDEPDHMTAYRDFASVPSLVNRAQQLAPPMDSQVLPPSSEVKVAQRSSLRNDFTYFGPAVNEDIHKQRLESLTRTREMTASDSVRESFVGKRRKMLTRSMVDYRHPVDRVQGNIKNMMVQHVSPYVRYDSLWSVNSEDKNTKMSETSDKFPWPCSRREVKRFQRGRNNDIVR